MYQFRPEPTEFDFTHLSQTSHPAYSPRDPLMDQMPRLSVPDEQKDLLPAKPETPGNHDMLRVSPPRQSFLDALCPAKP